MRPGFGKIFLEYRLSGNLFLKVRFFVDIFYGGEVSGRYFHKDQVLWRYLLSRPSSREISSMEGRYLGDIFDGGQVL